MKYYKGLELAIKDLHRRNEEAIVLDIGTGTGLLSMMAAKLGANQIYACEVIRNCIGVFSVFSLACGYRY
jgi:protein arginine N-methyltransferase 7